jgi:hypothetical protein
MTRKEIRDQALKAVTAIQAKAQRDGLDKLTDAEINAEIKAARADRKPPSPPAAPASHLRERLRERHHWNCDCLSCRPWTS